MINNLKNFLTFISLFIGTGFIAGSIVHFGEGITVWDSSVLAIGIFLFVGASYIQEYGKHHKRSTPGAFALFLFQSLLLAIGIGMASGGTQHFIDTPQYSAVLIPVGLSIGLIAFFWREEVAFSMKNWMSLLVLLVTFSGVFWVALLGFNDLIPETLRVGHGSYGHGGQEKKALINHQSEGADVSEPHFTDEHADDGHGH